ncbi:hypothetical protein [Mesorhizobium sp. IMUNJ 23232]|uniref:hypothetical protein n=1 Tax=Mesorhizobium sp. IMUNJ 23232 TaxID=3376064 RepID=UPI00378EAF8E
MIETSPLFATIPGAAEVVDWFGFVPTFHDAEVVGLDLRRRAPSRLNVYFWRGLNQTDERGHFICDRHAVVTFVMTDIIHIQLKGFGPPERLVGAGRQARFGSARKPDPLRDGSIFGRLRTGTRALLRP